MSSRILLFDPAERFVVGTVGVPGERTFFIQAREKNRLISVSLEKAQVSALADRILQILREVRSSEPLTTFERVVGDDQPLESPIDEEFRVGVIGLAYVSDRQLIEIDMQAIAESQFESDELIELIPRAIRIFCEYFCLWDMPKVSPSEQISWLVRVVSHAHSVVDR